MLRSLAAASVLAAILLAASASAETDTSCVSMLVPCAGDLNATKPSTACCSSISDAVKTQLPCLCSILGDNVLLKTFVANVTQALELPKRCGLNASPDACKNATAARAVSPGASPATTPPGGEKHAKDNSAAGYAIGWIGTSGLIGLLVLFVV